MLAKQAERLRVGCEKPMILAMCAAQASISCLLRPNPSSAPFAYRQLHEM